MNNKLLLGFVFLLGFVILAPNPKVKKNFKQFNLPKVERREPNSAPIKKPTPKPEPSISATSKGLIEAGKKYPGAMVCQSEPHPFLMQLAKEHANYQARIGVQGHQNFDSRFQRVIQAGLGRGAAEICAESWNWQVNESMYNLGWEMFKCWKYSPGHWSVASKKHKYYGADMARGANGIWYACIIVAD